MMGQPAIVVAALVLACAPGFVQGAEDDRDVAWAGLGQYRLMVNVKAAQAARKGDQRPAELAIDFDAELKKLGATGTVDIASIQVIAYDGATGKPSPGARYAYGRGEFDGPFRWYDAAIPYEFPEMNEAISRTRGKVAAKDRTRGGYFYNALGDWRAGRLVWMHAEDGEQPTLYAIYFDLLAEGKLPPSLPPAAWVGDGTPRRDKVGRGTFGSDHCRIDLDDWNGDGLVDVIVGEQAGHVFVWPNLGTKERPEFRYGKFIFADAAPLEAGMCAVPKVVDWDGDGAKDLLVGTEWNRLLFYRNAGTDRDRRLEYRGPVMVDGQPLEMPIEPLARGRSEIFKRDYYMCPETVDWDGDGDLDLLAGGYITGLVFFYENVDKAADGTPLLKLRGPLEADGKPLNVRYWCASPAAADLDGDGDLDLLSGNFPIYLRAGEKEETDVVLYFENVGSRTRPVLAERPLPGDGPRPHARLATPRLADWDGDGDLDLAVSSRENLYLFENQGSPAAPKFKLHAEPVATPWGMAGITADQFRDYNGDGRLDLVQNYTVRLADDVGNPFAWSESVGVLPRGQHIAHPSGIGDDWFWPFLDDFDQDGRIDVLFGDWGGHVWLHRNLSTADEQKFDLEGFGLKLADGEPIKVGPIGKDVNKDFDALQGARTVFTVADFDRDGRRDLVVGDTYGKIRYFRSLGPASAEDSNATRRPAFAAGVEIADLGIRGLVDATDWNGDGRMDVIASAASGRVRVLINRAAQGGAPFEEGFDPKLPPIFQPRVIMADINGDGDDDLFLPSTQGACFIERSFLDRGYAEAELVGTERKP
jgi:FG-GAP-like repeat